MCQPLTATQVNLAMNDLNSESQKYPLVGWGGLSEKSNVKMSQECPTLAIMHNMLDFCQ